MNCQLLSWRPYLSSISCLLILNITTELSRADEPFQPTIDETTCQTLFAFDNVSIPFTQNLRLEMRQPERHPANPVVRRGTPGSADAQAVQFYGSVIREGDRFRMWYVAVGDDDDKGIPASARWRPAYAESTDGIHWTKPNLGLVEFNGNRKNNLIQTDPSQIGFVNLKVLKDDDDPDPKRRFKITTHVYFRHKSRLGSLAPFASGDGLQWTMLTPASVVNGEITKDDLVLPAVHFEPCGGLYKWNSMFYACGQNAINAPNSYQGRITRMYRSADFVNWSQTSNVGFVRSTQQEYLGPGRSLEGEQNHEGISVWHRRNVLLGIYGRFHGAKEWKDVSVDLGFVISNDGLNFREPVNEWTWMRRGEDGQWDQGGLLQGQGFENIGPHTFVYYGAWDPRRTGQKELVRRGGVGIAVLPRDRFGELVVEVAGKGDGAYQLPEISSEFVTAPLKLRADASYRFYLNASGLGQNSALRVEILDANEKPIPRYSGDNAAVVQHAGFQTPVTWNGQQLFSELPFGAHLRVKFTGKQNTAIRFNAIYVQEVSP